MLVHRTKNIFTPPAKKSNKDCIGYAVGQETSFRGKKNLFLRHFVLY